MAEHSLTPVFSGEVQLAGWSESHTGGCKVTLWLPSSDDLEPFRALTARKGNTAGHRFMAAFVEIGDDELPVQPPKERIGALCLLACQWSNNEDFWTFADVFNEESAKQFILAACEIESRKELDTNPKAAENFEKFIRKPFMRYQTQ